MTKTTKQIMGVAMSQNQTILPNQLGQHCHRQKLEQQQLQQLVQQQQRQEQQLQQLNLLRQQRYI